MTGVGVELIISDSNVHNVVSASVGEYTHEVDGTRSVEETVATFSWLQVNPRLSICSASERLRFHRATTPRAWDYSH